MIITANDRRVLDNIERACREYDGYIPHGSSDWTAIKRLEKELLVECSSEWGDCQTCREPHEAPMFRLTLRGVFRVLAQVHCLGLKEQDR
jgi:hypothetical protein